MAYTQEKKNFCVDLVESMLSELTREQNDVIFVKQLNEQEQISSLRMEYESSIDVDVHPLSSWNICLN